MLKCFEAGIEIIVILLLLRGFQALLGVFGLVGGGVSIHDTHVINTVCTLRPKVSDEETPFRSTSPFEGDRLILSFPPRTTQSVYI